MNICIAESIRTQRKAHKLTQEKLAEALGVTVGAVSKWESGASIPEIEMIVHLADFFETSVDVLLGYEWKSGGAGKAIERIRALRNEKRFDEAVAEAERSLLKYPNRFDVVYQSAILFSVRGVERKEKRAMRRAQALYERSIELIEQNEDERVSEWTIRNRLADIQLYLGNTDEAIALMKKNNADGLNNGNIGFALATAAEKYEEALPYLSEAFVDSILTLHRVVVASANAYCNIGRNQTAIDALGWMAEAIRGMKAPDETSYFDMLEIQLTTGCAIIAAKARDDAAVRNWLLRTKNVAARFDAAPSAKFTGMRFFEGDPRKTAFSDFGRTAFEGVKQSFIADSENAAYLTDLWEEIHHE